MVQTLTELTELPLPVEPQPEPAYAGYCRCGTRVWSGPSKMSRPAYRETVICPNCGRDNSRRDFPLYHIWWLRRQRRLLKLRFRIWRWRLWHVHIVRDWEK